MTAGLRPTAGGVLAAYVVMLANLVPEYAGHLIACKRDWCAASLVIREA